MNDRECLLAIYNAIDELSQRLTGRPLTVRVPTEDGQVTIENRAAGREVPRGDCPEPCPRHPASSSAHHASG